MPDKFWVGDAGRAYTRDIEGVVDYLRGPDARKIVLLSTSSGIKEAIEAALKEAAILAEVGGPESSFEMKPDTVLYPVVKKT